MSGMDPTQTPQNSPAPEPTTPPAEPLQPASEPLAAVPAPTPPAPPVAPTPAPQPTVSGGHGRKILLVEDDDSLAGVYMARLEAEGFSVKRVANGEEALATALSYRPDLALLDIMMPKVSGFDVLDIIRNTPETAQLKVIMLTALNQEGDIDRAKSLGVDDYLVKSQVVISDVVERIRFHLAN